MAVEYLVYVHLRQITLGTVLTWAPELELEKSKVFADRFFCFLWFPCEEVLLRSNSEVLDANTAVAEVLQAQQGKVLSALSVQATVSNR